MQDTTVSDHVCHTVRDLVSCSSCLSHTTSSLSLSFSHFRSQSVTYDPTCSLFVVVLFNDSTSCNCCSMARCRHARCAVTALTRTISSDWFCDSSCVRACEQFKLRADVWPTRTRARTHTHTHQRLTYNMRFTYAYGTCMSVSIWNMHERVHVE